MPSHPPALITLLTDFGLTDVYVAVMKGAIARLNPAIPVIDLTHAIPPQNLAAARFNVMNAYPYFPNGTVHVAVVDPGVGSQRRGIAIQLADGFLVGPDNGIFSGVLAHHEAIAAVELTHPDFWRTPYPSSTFHGRDIFAPVAAYLATGTPFSELGTAISLDSLVTLSLPALEITPDGITGCIQHIDHFGNLITTIPVELVQHRQWVIDVGTQRIFKFQTYNESLIGNLLALMGSHGWVEIAVNGGSASAQLHVDLQAPISLRWIDPANLL